MKILVTGGNGYIGSSLNSYLSKKYDVTTVTRKDFDLINQREVTEWFKDKSYDVVIHTAIRGGSRLRKDDMSIVSENIMMHQNLFVNKHRYSKFISLGSGAELYNRNTPYGFSKHLIRESVLNNNNFYNIRIFALFDENELETRFIKSNITRYLNKNPMIIHRDKYMDFFYMKDFISLMQYYIENDKLPKEIDCTYETTYKLSEIANMINLLDGYTTDVVIENDKTEEKYCGTFNNIINYIGLSNGIQEVFKKLKNEK